MGSAAPLQLLIVDHQTSHIEIHRQRDAQTLLAFGQGTTGPKKLRGQQRVDRVFASCGKARLWEVAVEAPETKVSLVASPYLNT